jgi:succinylglutamic semialdehyde dehydrogenase
LSRGDAYPRRIDCVCIGRPLPAGSWRITVAGKNHFIANHWIEGTGPEFSSYDPATGGTTWQGKAATESEVAEAVAAAARALEEWSERSLSERLHFLEGFRDRLTVNKELLRQAICSETGKPRWEALTEVDSMIGKIAVSLEAHNDRCRTVAGELAGADTAVRFKPHGVVAVFGPFNFPGHLPNGHIVPALLAGNTVVFKPSGQAPLVGEITVQLWESTGIPPGVINMVQGRRETGAALAAHPRLDGLFFTGSAETGKAFHRAFGGRPEKILALEMGGNNPLIVHEASDPNAAAYTTILSAYITSGQRCSCARRLIVPRGPEGDRFVERLASWIDRVRVGLPTDTPEPFMGPVISPQEAQRLLAVQEAFKEKGGIALREMRSLRGITSLLSPGLMDVTGIADRGDEEFFGPFLQLIRVPDFEAALREANNTSFGLAAGLISDDKELYEIFRRRIRAGVVNWNRQTTGASSRMPFGGIGSSGNHRPGAFFAADYCSYPVASIESDRLVMPESLVPGIEG